jgi:ATP/maltotriose-dependent transcriptional regulator MalT/two-component SAPR family response regulator
MTEVLLSKLIPPGESLNIIYRENILKDLGKKQCPQIFVISAPAGYGKTILALQLSRKLSRKLQKPLGWYRLDRRDNDPAIFLQYLAESLRRHWPDLFTKALQLTTMPGAVVRQPRFAAALIINDLIRSGANPVIILDDYHEVEDPSVHSIIQEILEQIPPGITVIITSRTGVPLSLHRQYISGTARLINTAELSFTKEESDRFLELRFGPQHPDLLGEIFSITRGWPAVLELAGSLQIEQEDPCARLNPLGDKSLYAYLVAEVFEKMPAQDREFLVNCSVYKVLNPERCNRLLDINNAEEILTRLVEKLLVLSPLSGERCTYFCHQLFRDFLLDRLGDKKSELQRRAARLALASGEIEKAIEFFLQAGMNDEAIKALEKGGRLVLQKGRWQTLARWLLSLNEREIAGSAWLSYFQAVIEAYRGHLEKASQWTSKAIIIFTERGETVGIGECHLLKARLLRCRGHYRESLSLLEEAAVEMSETDFGDRFELALEKGLCLALAGDMPAAEIVLTNSMAAAKKACNSPAVAHLAETLGHLHYQQGRHAKALKTYREAIQSSPDQALPGYYIQDAIPYIYRDWGLLDKAMEWANKSIAAKERYGMLETLPSAYCAKSYVNFETGNFSAVEELIGKALELQYEHNDERYFLLLNQSLLAWCRFARGCWVEANQMLAETLAAAEEQTDLACALSQMMIGTVYALMGRLPEAHEVLHRSEINLKKMNFITRLCEAYKALAYVHYARNEIKEFQNYARLFLQLGAKLNYIGNALQPTATLLEPILRFSLEYDVEVIFAQRILVRLGERMHQLLLELAEHPNPSVRYRVIAPLAELSDETTQAILSTLAKDNSELVSCPVTAYLKQKTIPPKGDEPESDSQDNRAPLTVKTFGTFQVFSGNHELAGWRTRKTRELLTLMLHLEAPAGKERLIEELWPESDPQNCNSLFRTTMHYLRKQLANESLGDLVLCQHHVYTLRKDYYTLDWKIFERLVTEGTQEEPLKEVGAGMLSRAVRLYKGDYLTEAVDYSWAVPRKLYLKNLYTEALLNLARYYRSRGKHTRARDFLLLLVEADPLCETAHRLMMQVYNSLGERQALLDEKTRFGLMLREEIGLPPDPATNNLYLRLGCSG